MIWLPYTALAVNLLIIWFMPKRLTNQEIYTTWVVVALINLSTDILLSLSFKQYELGPEGIQHWIHFLEWTLAASFGVIFLNFMPTKTLHFYLYTLAWLVFSLAFEAALVMVDFINYYKWELWYSAPYYFATFLFLRLHIYWFRKT